MKDEYVRKAKVLRVIDGDTATIHAFRDVLFGDSFHTK